MRKTAINLASVIGGEVLLRVANFGAVVVIARLYGAATLGLYATALAYATVAVMIAEMGLQISSITEIGRSREAMNSVITRFFVLRLSLFGVMSVALALIGWLSRWHAEVWTVGILVTVRVLLYSYSQLQFAVLKGLDRMPLIGQIQALDFLLLLIGIGGAYLKSWSLNTLLGCFIVAQTVEVILGASCLWRWGVRPARFAVAECWQLLKRSTPVGASYVIAGTMLRIDILVLSALGSRADVGRFAAAHIGIVFTYSLSWLFGSVLLTDFIRLLDTPQDFERYTRRWTRLLALFAGVGAIVMCVVARPVILFLYGQQFRITASLTSIMVLAIPFIFLNAVYLSRAIALGAVRTYLAIYMGTMIVAVPMDIVMARTYQGMGIAVAIVLREIAMFSLFMFQGRSLRAAETAELEKAAWPVEETIDV